MRVYKSACRLIENPEEFGFMPAGKDKSISIAPPKGSGVMDHIDLTEAFIEGRKRAFTRYVEEWQRTQAAVECFKDRREFIVIRMYYFNEDAHGHDRGTAKPYSFEDIADELSGIGIMRSVRSLRTWRSKLVQDMAVLIFGEDAAITIDQRE